MPRPEYAPFLTSPRGASASMGRSFVAAAPRAVSALGSAASGTLSAALSVAKLNLHRRRRQTFDHLTDSGTGRRSTYVDCDDDDEADDNDNGADDDDDDDPFEPLPSSAAHAHKRLQRPSSQLRLQKSVRPAEGLVAPSPSTRSRSSSATSPSSLRDEAMSSSMVSDGAPPPLPELSSDRVHALVSFIDRSVDSAHNLSLGFGRVRWTPSRARDGVTIRRARSGPDDATLDAAVRGSCNISATSRELSDLLITETTADFAEFEHAVNPSEFLDGQVLYTLVPRTPEERFVCVKWHCTRSMASSVAKHRDYVYVELVDSFKDEDGRRIGYRLSKSVDLDVLPPRDTKHLFVRAKTLTLQTWSERAPGSLEFVTMMINDLGDGLPSWLVHKMVDAAAMRSACIRDHINQRRLDMLVYAGPRDMVPLSRRICCVVCTRSFSLVRKKYSCAACGDVVCSQCSVHQLVTAHQRLSDLSAPGGKRKTRICLKCSSTMQNKELPRRASSARHSEISHVSSEGSVRSSLASNGSFLARSHVSAGKTSDETRRSFLSDSTAGTSSQDSVEDSGRGSSNGSSTLRKQVPSVFQVRLTSSSLGKSERLSKASTSSLSPGHDEDRLGVEGYQTQVLGDSVHAPAPVKLDLGVEKYKEILPTRHSERKLDVEAPKQAKYSNMGGKPTVDGAGNFLDTEGYKKGPMRQSAAVVTLEMDMPPVRKVEVASFLTEEENAKLDTASSDSESASFLTVDENSKIVESRSFGRRSETGVPVPVQVEELIIEEVTPENFCTVPRRSKEFGAVGVEELVIEEVEPVTVSFVPRRSFKTDEFVAGKVHPEHGGIVPRRSIIKSEQLVDGAAQSENARNASLLCLDKVEVEVPMVVRKVPKRVVVGSGRRQSRETRRAPSLRPAGAPPPPPRAADSLSDNFASVSKKNLVTGDGGRSAPSSAPVQGSEASEEEAIKVEDLQMHLDRMNQISARLRVLQTTETPVSTQTAMAALTTFETKAKAERAAKIAANFVSLLDRHAAPAARRAQQYLKQCSNHRTSLFNLTLAMGDGSFVDYLVDSTFEDIGESPDGTGSGWQSVLSQTTGKQYFYNQNCALASWTLPGPDVFRGTLYMVL
ncbi:unnamed protein product [Hyaloperonospora brassicae]|uniref:FYVE-type domain-containing protein n=1 Tax=Hyaloperonospora brassicae TaxID=162125 RepID=A0AAV0T071_HYABA|nr:unnamed protein product [Hyaloperonospora brassicae]